MLSRLRRLSDEHGWELKVIGSGHQHDSWSCGIWTLYAMFAMRQFVKGLHFQSLSFDVFFESCIAKDGLMQASKGDEFLDKFCWHITDRFYARASLVCSLSLRSAVLDLVHTSVQAPVTSSSSC